MKEKLFMNWKVIVASIALLMVVIIGFNYFQHPEKKEIRKAVIKPAAPRVYKVDSTNAAAYQPKAAPLAGPVKDDPDYVTGVVEPFMDVTLGLFVPGRIDRLLYSEGKRVQKGAVILTLDYRQEELEVARRKMLWLNRAELKSAEAAARTLTESLRSNRILYDETRSVSREELDKLSLQCESAIAERDRLIVQKKREKVEYEMALKSLESRALKAPFSGIVEKVFLKEGEIYQTSQPLVRLIDSDRCMITLNLDDSRSYHLEQGMTVDLLISAGEKEIKKEGVIIKVPQVVDPASGVMQVKVVFENSDNLIKPGVTGRMRLPKK
jgi:RND family efflux transporter MFP subunit